MNDIRRLTLEPGKRDGRACVRGLRISVHDVLAMLAGMAQAEILEDLSELERADMRACLAYGAGTERSVAKLVAP